MKKLLKTKPTQAPELPKFYRREILLPMNLPCLVRMTVQQDEGDTRWYVDTVSEVKVEANHGVRTITDLLTDDQINEIGR